MWCQHDSLPWTAQGRSKGSTSDSQVLKDNLGLCRFHVLPRCRQFSSYFGVCGSFNLLPGSYAFLYSFLLSRSPFLAFKTLNLLSTELKLFSLKPLKAVVLLLTLLCSVSPRFTKIGETLEGLIFPITSLITNHSASPKCALSCCLRWYISHMYAH